MYHGRFKKSHYEAGFHWGELLYRRGVFITHQPTFTITPKRRAFANQCLPIYEQYFPEILEEIKGVAAGQKASYEDFYTFLFSMYCFAFQHHCTCMAWKDEDHILFGRNSDFLVSLEKLYMNCLYQLDHAYAFQGNTTAFIEMEDGINEYGLAVGLTFLYPAVVKPGINAGLLVRLLLEKCKTTKEAIAVLKQVPIASQQAITIADPYGYLAVVECNCEKTVVIKPDQNGRFLVSTNEFQAQEMQAYQNKCVDNWRAEERYSVAYHALTNHKYIPPLTLMKNILSGKYGFMCQYDRTQDADTVWSVLYDIKQRSIYRVEGNPGRKPFRRDTRMKFQPSSSSNS